MYLASPWRPADIGLQLDKVCYPLQQVGVEAECFYFFCFFIFIHLPLSPLSLSSPLLSFLSLFSLSLEDDTKWPTRVDVSLNPNTINQPSTAGIFTRMQPTQDHNGSINLDFIICTENITIRQSNQCGHRSDLKTLAWFFLFGVYVSLNILRHLLFIENMAIRQINQCILKS